MQIRQLAPILLLASSLTALAACLAPVQRQAPDEPVEALQWSYQADLPVSRAPFEEVHANWKQRLDQPYVFIEHTGNYTRTGALLPEVFELMRAQGLKPSGPPFALFYDDPGRVPVARLRSRACVPVSGPLAPEAPLRYEVLPSTTVVYALVGGPYPEVPRSYPGLYAFLDRMSWVEDGPVREVYLVSPAAVSDYNDLMTEVQLPATTE